MAHIYNSIPHIEEAARCLPDLQSSVLPQLNNLLTNYDLESKFGVVLVHRHFDLVDAEEQVVDLKGPGTIVSSVFKNGQPDSQIVNEYALEVPEVYTIVPAKFIVRDELVPYEYMCVPKEEERAYTSHTQDLPIEFLREWYIILRNYCAEDKMGLADLLTADDENGTEHTDHERRLNIVTLSEYLGGANYVPTLWQPQGDSKQPARHCCCGG
jgi:hypothetical protein